MLPQENIPLPPILLDMARILTSNSSSRLLSLSWSR